MEDVLELLLLGTGAAEGWPAPWCICPNCEEARRRGGPNLRSRSGALIDDVLKVDYSADTLLHMQQCRRSLAQIKTLVFTHQHSDHVLPEELIWIRPPFTQTPPSTPIALYGNAQVLALVNGVIAKHPALGDYFELHRLKAHRQVTTATGDEILPLPADHVEGALVLRITRNGKTLFYGHDSGLYPQVTLDALTAGPTLNIVLLDCTSGGQKTTNRGHMSVEGVVLMAEELRRRGAITDSTRVIATHFSHNGGLLHEELVHTFLPHRIEVAFDGMTVRV
jgi:phosphoribosyl 1,2-cyclic phosphate phosphodiesterase